MRRRRGDNGTSQRRRTSGSALFLGCSLRRAGQVQCIVGYGQVFMAIGGHVSSGSAIFVDFEGLGLAAGIVVLHHQQAAVIKKDLQESILLVDFRSLVMGSDK